MNAALILFFQEPGEIKNGLSAILKTILNNPNEDFNARDQAYFYYKLLSTDIKQLETILRAKIDNGKIEYFEDAEKAKEKLSLEFNTLSLVFQKPPSKFIKSYAYLSGQRMREGQNVASQTIGNAVEEEEEQLDIDQIKKEVNDEMEAVESENPMQVNQENENGDNDLLSLGGASASGSGAALSVSDIDVSAEIDPDFFQTNWVSFPET